MKINGKLTDKIAILLYFFGFLSCSSAAILDKFTSYIGYSSVVACFVSVLLIFLTIKYKKVF